MQNNLNSYYWKKAEKNVRMLISLWQGFSLVESKLEFASNLNAVLSQVFQTVLLT